MQMAAGQSDVVATWLHKFKIMWDCGVPRRPYPFSLLRGGGGGGKKGAKEGYWVW